TDITMLPSSASSRRDSVDLPAPEGEDSTNIKPRRTPEETTEGIELQPSKLFNILNLFAELIDRRLEVKPDPVQIHGRRLVAQGRRLPVQFLRQKIELAAHRPARLHQPARLLDVGLEAVQLFPHVGL